MQFLLTHAVTLTDYVKKRKNLIVCHHITQNLRTHVIPQFESFLAAKVTVEDARLWWGGGRKCGGEENKIIRDFDDVEDEERKKRI
jgi:hypothetical protein